MLNRLAIVLLIVAVVLLALVSGVAIAQESEGRSVVVSWDIPTERENGGPLSVEEIGGYEIRYSVDGGEAESVVIPDGSATGYQLSGLSGGEYRLTIAAYDVNGLYSEFVSLEARVLTAGPVRVMDATVSVVPSPDPAEVCADSPRCRVDVLSARYGNPSD